MPQLDLTQFPPQLVWLVLVFSALYALMAKLALPEWLGLRTKRDKATYGVIQEAKAILSDAESRHARVEETLRHAKAEAAQSIAAVHAALHQEIIKRSMAHEKQMVAQTKVQDKEMDAWRASLVKDIQHIAEEVTLRLSATLLPFACSQTDIVQAVEKACHTRQEERHD